MEQGRHRRRLRHGLSLAPLEIDMKSRVMALTVAGGIAVVLSVSAVAQQSVADEHFARARSLAGKDFADMYDTSCGFVRPETVINPVPAPAAAAPAPGPPPRASWYAEPVKVFDNLYFL